MTMRMSSIICSRPPEMVATIAFTSVRRRAELSRMRTVRIALAERSSLIIFPLLYSRTMRKTPVWLLLLLPLAICVMMSVNRAPTTEITTSTKSSTHQPSCQYISPSTMIFATASMMKMAKQTSSNPMSTC